MLASGDRARALKSLMRNDLVDAGPSAGCCALPDKPAWEPVLVVGGQPQPTSAVPDGKAKRPT